MPFWFSVCELSLRWLTSRRVRRVDKLLVMKLMGRRIRRVNKLLVIKDKLVLMLPCLWNNQLVYSSTRSLVHSSTCYSKELCSPVTLSSIILSTINLFTCLTCSLVHLQQKTVPRSAKTLARYVTNAVELLLRRFSSLTPQPGRNSVGGYIQGKQLEPSCR
mgnify:CR=1 FL=1